MIMWKQSYSQSVRQSTSHQEKESRNSALQILPCTVSQLLSARRVGTDTFVISHCRELSQVSVVGVVGGFSPFDMNVQFTVDDMTAPPLHVKHWMNTEDCAFLTFAPPGTYMKVIGSLRVFKGQMSLMANDIRCLSDLNEITSHLLEVTQAHMQLSEGVLDVNMNTSLVSSKGLSTIQDEVLHVIKRFSHRDQGVTLTELKTELHRLEMADIRSSLSFLLKNGLVFSTIDDDHYKPTELD